MKILKFIKSFCFNFLVIVSVLVLGVRLLGFIPYNIRTISMGEEYPPNTLVFVHKVDFEDLTAGDVITYINEAGSSVTHRIVEVNETEESLVTKGDSNDCNDILPVYKENVVGKVFFKVPCVGIVSNIAEKIVSLF